MLRTVASIDGSWLWILAVAFGISGQLLFTLQQIWPGRMLFILSAAVGYVAWKRIGGLAPDVNPESTEIPVYPTAGRMNRATAAVFLASAVVSLLVVPWIVAARHYDLSIVMWIVALVAAVLGAA